MSSLILLVFVFILVLSFVKIGSYENLNMYLQLEMSETNRQTVTALLSQKFRCGTNFVQCKKMRLEAT